MSNYRFYTLTGTVNSCMISFWEGTLYISNVIIFLLFSSYFAQCNTTIIVVKRTWLVICGSIMQKITLHILRVTLWLFFFFSGSTSSIQLQGSFYKVHITFYILSWCLPLESRHWWLKILRISMLYDFTAQKIWGWFFKLTYSSKLSLGVVSIISCLKN